MSPPHRAQSHDTDTRGGPFSNLMKAVSSYAAKYFVDYDDTVFYIGGNNELQKKAHPLRFVISHLPPSATCPHLLVVSSFAATEPSLDEGLQHVFVSAIDLPDPFSPAKEARWRPMRDRSLRSGVLERQATRRLG